ncbi:MAG: hypothetical protein ACI9QD_000335 [Thermoproteota archaeon]|jgi:hypothetical protein
MKKENRKNKVKESNKKKPVVRKKVKNLAKISKGPLSFLRTSLSDHSDCLSKL